MKLTLHSDVGSETSLSDTVTNSGRVVSLLSSGELEGDSVGDDGGVSVSDVGERSSVDEDGGSLDDSMKKRSQDRENLGRKRGREGEGRERTSSVCMRVGLMASFMRTARAPEHPMSSAVIASPALEVATTILPSLRREDEESRARISTRDEAFEKRRKEEERTAAACP